MTELTTIQLSPLDARAFVQFQKHYAFIMLLESLGAFDISSGTLQIRFDSKGQITSLDVHRHYKTPKVK